MQPGRLNIMKKKKQPDQSYVCVKVVRWIVMDDQLPIGFHQVQDIFG